MYIYICTYVCMYIVCMYVYICMYVCMYINDLLTKMQCMFEEAVKEEI